MFVNPEKNESTGQYGVLLPPGATKLYTKFVADSLKVKGSELEVPKLAPVPPA